MSNQPSFSEASSPQTQRHNLLRLILVGCGVVILLTIFCCCLFLLGSAVAYRSAYPPLPAEPEALLDIVDDQVVALRGLEFKTPVSFTLITTTELRAKIQTEFDDEWSVTEARDAAITLAAFDLLDAETDLYQLYLNLYTEQLAGYYDVEEKTLYIISGNDTLSVAQRLTLAHELTHALQDQYFDLDKLTNDEENEAMDSEAEFAFRSLVEGEASLVEQRYLFQLAPHEFVLLIQEVLRQDTSVLDETPPVIAESLGFPYQEGLAFVTDLYEQGGWSAVEGAYADPPLSTEQILHPDRYRAGDAPHLVTVPPLTDTLGNGWRWVDEDVMGEFGLRLHLETHLTPTLASQAVEGWGGDRYAVYHNDDQDVSTLLLHTTWDTPAEAAEFLSAYTLYLDQAADRVADLDTDNRRCWQIPGDYRCLWWAEDEVIIIRAPEISIVERILETLGRE